MWGRLQRFVGQPERVARSERPLPFHRLLGDYDAIVSAACNAWNRLMAEAGRITALFSYPWIPKVNA